MIIELSGKEYEIAKSLRVAFEMQKDFGKLPYMKIFEEITDRPLEDQIKMIYVAFRIKNPNVMTKDEFIDLVLDEWTLDGVWDVINKLMNAITGKKDKEPTEVEEEKTTEQQEKKS